MSSITYDIFVGLLGLFLAGALYSIFDEINMHYLYDIAIKMNLNGSYINIFVWMWGLVAIVITLAFVIGLYVKAKYSKE